MPGWRAELALGALLALLAPPLAAQSSDPWRPPAGSNRVFETEPGAAPGARLMVNDLVLGPDAVGAKHYHPWEEYLYVIEGSAHVEMEGAPTRFLVAGERFVIPARQVHTPRAGPQGVRAIVVRLHRLADPETIPVRP